jgi:hypothetical protein
MSLPKMFDAHKAWLCSLIALATALASYRHGPLIVGLVPIPFSLAGVLFGVRALVRGPLRVLGCIFLVINASLSLASVCGLFLLR